MGAQFFPRATYSLTATRVPWPRGASAQLLELLSRHGRKVVAFRYLLTKRVRCYKVLALTAWELAHRQIPVTVLVDAAAAHLLKTGRVGCCIVGADRITANGDTANKIGTYGLALLAKAHNVPFFVAAPSSTFDLDSPIWRRDTD